MKDIEEILNTSILTSRIKNTLPISLMLIGESGAGKSKTLLRFSAPYIKRCDDLTSAGLYDILVHDKDISFILIPDFNVVLSHKSSVSNLLIANLLSVTSDGLVQVADGRAQKELKHKPVGVITAITRDMFITSHNRWKKLGIIRRFLALHYDYSNETVQKALQHIRDGFFVLDEKIMPNGNFDDPYINEEIEKHLDTLTLLLSTHMGEYINYNREDGKWIKFVKQGKPILPMSPYIVLRAMARAHAIKDGRENVDIEDIDFLKMMLRFTSMHQPGII